jgi:hypothetical protein
MDAVNTERLNDDTIHPEHFGPPNDATVQSYTMQVMTTCHVEQGPVEMDVSEIALILQGQQIRSGQ